MAVDREGPYAEEARRRWGDTDAYRESAKRTGTYGPAQWDEIRAHQDANEAAFAEAMKAGAPADGSVARALAEDARLLIDRWFYPCSREMHAGLAGMYTGDERFRAHYDDRAEGLAAYVAEAIQANLIADAANG